MHKYILILVALFLVGCSPKYVIKNQYIAPKDKAFSTCVKKCEVQKKECLRTANEDYQICINSAYNRAKEISNEQFLKYDRSYEEYLLDYRDFKRYKHEYARDYRKLESDYNYFSKECHTKKDNFTCRRENELKNRLLVLKRDRLKRPEEPKKPSFNRILKSQQNLCRVNNSCSKSFDICYVNCGGEVIPYRFCVKNCD